MRQLSVDRVALCIFILVGLTSVTLLIVTPALREARVSAAHSSILSLYDGINDAQIEVRIGREWRILSATETAQALARIREVGIAVDDSGLSADSTEEVCDPWGNVLQIAARKSESGTATYVIWSRGVDGVSGTDDDIVVPGSMKETVKREVASKGAR